MATIKLEYTITDEQAKTIALGLGYEEFVTEIDSKGDYISVENKQDRAKFIANHFTSYIADTVKRIFVTAEVNKAINATSDFQKEVEAEISANTKVSIK